jgi:hypothetical protein
MYTMFLAFSERFVLYESNTDEFRHGLVPQELITIPSDYRSVIEEQDEFSRPSVSGTLFEADHTTTLTNGEMN